MSYNLVGIIVLQLKWRGQGEVASSLLSNLQPPSSTVLPPPVGFLPLEILCPIFLRWLFEASYLLEKQKWFQCSGSIFLTNSFVASYICLFFKRLLTLKKYLNYLLCMFASRNHQCLTQNFFCIPTSTFIFCVFRWNW